MTRLSVVVPARNEAGAIEGTLLPLQPLRGPGCEVVVVDGGSGDDTALRAARLADRVLHSPPGRARQMNAGARAARGDILLFLHADTLLPAGAVEAVRSGLRGRYGWGRFDVRLTGRHPLLRVVERGISWRSRLTGIASGDQAMFVRRDWFEAAGGFPEIPLMEDLALSRTLNARGRPLCLRSPVLTSSRRWERRGIVRTILLMWRLRLAYYLGADPARLADRYR